MTPAQPALFEPPLVTVRQKRRLYEVCVAGVAVSLEVSACAALAKAERLRAHRDEADELLDFARHTIGGQP